VSEPVNVGAGERYCHAGASIRDVPYFRSFHAHLMRARAGETAASFMCGRAGGRAASRMSPALIGACWREGAAAQGCVQRARSSGVMFMKSLVSMFRSSTRLRSRRCL
jgi:hypothetical protein